MTKTIADIFASHKAPHNKVRQARALGYDFDEAYFLAATLTQRRRDDFRPLEIDPLVSRSNRRKVDPNPGLTLAMQKKRRREIGEFKAELARLEAVRADLLRGARVARSMGWSVQSSKSKSGRVSSYYVTPPGGGRRYRISDHDVPTTVERQTRSECYGRTFDGTADIYASAAPIRRNTWWRRALTLMAAGYDVSKYE